MLSVAQGSEPCSISTVLMVEDCKWTLKKEKKTSSRKKRRKYVEVVSDQRQY